LTTVKRPPSPSMSIPNHPQHPMPATPPALDPPFKGYIETTFDSLLVFEAARRGMIPRVTRRLIERERGMVQSGAVFVFDEQESGIKRWTDGLVWSPSRILGNFLVSRPILLDYTCSSQPISAPYRHWSRKSDLGLANPIRCTERQTSARRIPLLRCPPPPTRTRPTNTPLRPVGPGRAECPRRMASHPKWPGHRLATSLPSDRVRSRGLAARARAAPSTVRGSALSSVV
jgi:hypothetical protein